MINKTSKEIVAINYLNNLKVENFNLTINLSHQHDFIDNPINDSKRLIATVKKPNHKEKKLNRKTRDVSRNRYYKQLKLPIG